MTGKIDDRYVRNAVRSYQRVKIREIPDLHPVTVFNRFYEAARDGNGCIDRQSFSPMDHPRLLPHLQLYERWDGRFKVRLMGTGAVKIVEGDHTGRFMDEYAPPDFLAQRVAEVEECLHYGRPVFSTSKVPNADLQHTQVFRGAFPAYKGDLKLIFLPIAEIDTLILP